MSENRAILQRFIYASVITGFLSASWEFAISIPSARSYLGGMDWFFYLVGLLSLYILPALFLGVGLGLIGSFFYYSDLPFLLKKALFFFRQHNEEEPHFRFIAYVVSIGLSVAFVIFTNQKIIYQSNRIFHNKSLSATLCAVVGLLVVIIAILAVFPLGYHLDLFLQWLMPTRRWIRFFSSFKTGHFLFILLFIGLLSGIIYLKWNTIQLIDWRPVFAGGGSFFLLIVLFGLSFVKKRMWQGHSVIKITIITALFFLIPSFLLLHSAQKAQVRKAIVSHATFGALFMDKILSNVDFDRDGYSPFHGDCNDWNKDINPSALDIPNNGIDENCSGGDFKKKKHAIVSFYPIPKQVPRDLNVLLITLDAVPASHLGCYGYKRNTTPNIDAVAKEGQLFLNSYSPSPSTRLSIPAIMTSRTVSSIVWGQSSWPPPVQPINLTWAETMKKYGYKTGAIVPHRYFAKKGGLNQGFDDYDNSLKYLYAGSDQATRGSSSKQMTKLAIKWLDTKYRNTKFFFWVHYYDPHWFYEKHKDAKNFGDKRVDIYDNELSYADKYIGRLLAHVKRLGLWDKTMIIISSDHGEGFGEHGVWLHGYHLYRQQTHVPIIYRIPNMKPRKIYAPMGHIDMLPTTINLIRGKNQKEFLGTSAAQHIITGKGPKRMVFQEVWYADRGPFTHKKGLITKNWHLLYNMLPSNTYELYNLKDKSEKHDVWNQKKLYKIRQKLRSSLGQWIDSIQTIPYFWERVHKYVKTTPPKIQYPIDIQFGDAIHLIGVDILHSNVSTNGKIQVKYHFYVAKKLRKTLDIRLFLHLLGSRFLNADHSPIDGAYPIKKWKAKQYITDFHQYPLNNRISVGQHVDLWLGFYSKKTRKRLKIRILKKNPHISLKIRKNAVFLGKINVIHKKRPILRNVTKRPILRNVTTRPTSRKLK